MTAKANVPTPQRPPKPILNAFYLPRGLLGHVGGLLRVEAALSRARSPTSSPIPAPLFANSARAPVFSRLC